MAEAAADLLRATVNGAQDHEMTWEQVGAVLGVSRQAAHERFATPSR